MFGLEYITSVGCPKFSVVCRAGTLKGMMNLQCTVTKHYRISNFYELTNQGNSFYQRFSTTNGNKEINILSCYMRVCDVAAVLSTWLNLIGHASAAATRRLVQVGPYVYIFTHISPFFFLSLSLLHFY
jgi:hypothetical protein